MPMRFLLLFFIGIPILEMIVLIKVGGMIGAIPTVGLVVLTATIGVWLLKREGLATLTRLQQKMAQGELPGKELLEGVMLIIGGALLLTPGFVTDAIGFVCLIPWLRQPVATWLLNHTQLFQGTMQMGGMRMGGMQMGEMQRDNFDNEPTGAEQNRHRIINGEFETEDDKKLD
ncbi:FxsA family protein [Pseudomonadales bacterium]|nr:FxsA family protein [Pseudomonadales bacterium]